MEILTLVDELNEKVSKNSIYMSNRIQFIYSSDSYSETISVNILGNIIILWDSENDSTFYLGEEDIFIEYLNNKLIKMSTWNLIIGKIIMK